MSDLNIEIDFTDINAATGNKLGVLNPGLHTGEIVEFSHFTDSGSVLYCYMETDGVRHRERFNLSNEKALPFVKAFLLSAGISEKKLGGSSQVPFAKLVGKIVRFNYTPPQIDENGVPVKGTYASYTFYDKKRYEKVAAMAHPVMAKKEATIADASGNDDFSFLEEDE
jgi:hypothetical protein